MISVIIPLYNAIGFVEKAINSVLLLNEVLELLVVDDGSTDGSYELALELSQKEKRIILLSHKNRENRGAAASRNLGVEYASYPFIAFLDADDTYYLNRFLEPILLLKNNPSIDACFGIVEIKYLDSGNSKLFGSLNIDDSTSILTYLLQGGYFHTNSVTVRKKFFKEIGLFDQSCWPHEDSELWIRMAAMGKLKSICEKNPIASYTIHGNNLSKVASIRSKRKMWSMVYKKVFRLPIGFRNRSLILRQLVKIWLKTWLFVYK
ncbi:glycosyltransferase family 2 protein [Algoriphagus winogradskyi]|uniref:Glycosyl transferase family 2 n=1 Tax=Algoriphagus winogradskyi TaxID=237017 RepID=A0ABY1NZ93_9BACT|nr:glycosyltransferase family A protein [Algoriphagus winogradskyi]SMP19832.1 Glycosyl transferase family 2 [Algoriphagus winogradskyi]